MWGIGQKTAEDNSKIKKLKVWDIGKQLLVLFIIDQFIDDLIFDLLVICEKRKIHIFIWKMIVVRGNDLINDL